MEIKLLLELENSTLFERLAGKLHGLITNKHNYLDMSMEEGFLLLLDKKLAKKIWRFGPATMRPNMVLMCKKVHWLKKTLWLSALKSDVVLHVDVIHRVEIQASKLALSGTYYVHNQEHGCIFEKMRWPDIPFYNIKEYLRQQLLCVLKHTKACCNRCRLPPLCLCILVDLSSFLALRLVVVIVRVSGVDNVVEINYGYGFTTSSTWSKLSQSFANDRLRTDLG
ncbi:unnamed protein product [Sphenostylis stenocarpa]|uniref:Uncharacterized protein n=1 Tax=Sphenostylis stenocarpa TaxID=92480 RepID=A0AA86V5B4_9FABA|nr:unnamed protein product [Sphenostylis stenocarpa]